MLGDVSVSNNSFPMKIYRKISKGYPLNSTKVTSDYIKGLCIILICWHHLIYNNFPTKFSYLGHQFVIFFFILSGYGIFHSLNSTNNKITSPSRLAVYFLKRAGRIYPLYWLWILTSYDLQKLNLSDFFLLSLDNPPVWFLNSIVYCYIAAPGLYFIIKKTGTFSMVLLTLITLIINALLDLLNIPTTLCFAYCKIYFSYIFAFGCGMALAKPIDLKINSTIYNIFLVSIFLIFTLSALQVSMFKIEMLNLPNVKIYYYSVNPYTVPFFFSAILITFLLMNGHPALPLKKFVVLFGKYSLPIYLFHVHYDQFIVKTLGLDQPELYYFVVFIVFLPLLLGGCALIALVSDKISGIFVSNVENLINKKAGMAPCGE